MEKKYALLFLLATLNIKVFALGGGTYTVGTGGDYTTLPAAITAVNGGITGAVTLLLMDDSYTVTSPLIIQAGANINSTNTLTIKPNSGKSLVIITGSLTNSIFKINGASYITIEGSNNGTLSKKSLTSTFDGGNNGFDDNITTTPSIKTYVNNTFTYPTTTLASGGIADQPYCLFIRGDRTICLSQGASAPPNSTILRAKGVLNQTGGTNSILKGYSGTSGYYYMIGNPYASSIDLTHVIDGTRSSANNGFVLNQVTVWDPKLYGTYGDGAYVTWNNGIWSATVDDGGSYPSGSGNPPIIQSGQAFMLQSNSSTVNVQFQEDDKATTEFNVFGKSSNLSNSVIPIVYTNLMAEDNVSLIDGVAAGFANKFSASVDDDAQKKFNDANSISINRNGKNLAIELKPKLKQEDTLFFKLNVKAQTYALRIFAKDVSKSSLIDGLFIDKYLNRHIPIQFTSSYSYKFEANADTNSYKNRFMLVLKPGDFAKSFINQSTSITKNNIQGKILIYSNPIYTNDFTLSMSGMQKGKYSIDIYNENGSVVITRHLDYKSHTKNYKIQVNQNWANGLYMLKIRNQDGQIVNSLKLILSRG